MIKKIFYFLTVCLMATQAYAGLLISKPYIVLDGKKSDVLQFTNMSKKKMKYRVWMENYKQKPSGQYEKVSDSRKRMAADDLVYISPKSFILDSKQTQTIRVMRKGSKNKDYKNAQNGEYRSHLVVQEVEELDTEYVAQKAKSDGKTLSFKITGLMGMSIPVILRKGNLHATADIVKAELRGNNTMNVQIARNGNKSLRGDVVVLANKKKEVGKLGNVAIYTENKVRSLKIPLDMSSLKGKKVKSLKVEYRNTEGNKKNVLATYDVK